jgi:hypothetical protein
MLQLIRWNDDPKILCACALVVKYVFLISNGHDFIQADTFLIMATISCIVFSTINLFKKFILAHTKNYPDVRETSRLMISGIKVLSLLALLTKLDLCLKHFTVTI